MKWSSSLPKLSFEHYRDPFRWIFGGYFSPSYGGWGGEELTLYCGPYTFTLRFTWPERSTP